MRYNTQEGRVEGFQAGKGNIVKHRSFRESVQPRARNRHSLEFEVPNHVAGWKACELVSL